MPVDPDLAHFHSYTQDDPGQAGLRQKPAYSDNMPLRPGGMQGPSPFQQSNMGPQQFPLSPGVMQGPPQYPPSIMQGPPQYPPSLPANMGLSQGPQSPDMFGQGPNGQQMWDMGMQGGPQQLGGIAQSPNQFQMGGPQLGGIAQSPNQFQMGGPQFGGGQPGLGLLGGMPPVSQQYQPQQNTMYPPTPPVMQGMAQNPFSPQNLSGVQQPPTGNQGMAPNPFSQAPNPFSMSGTQPMNFGAAPMMSSAAPTSMNGGSFGSPPSTTAPIRPMQPGATKRLV